MLVRAFPAPDLRRRVTYSPANPYASAGGFQEAMTGQRFLRLMPPERKICGKRGSACRPFPSFMTIENLQSVSSIVQINRKHAKHMFCCS